VCSRCKVDKPSAEYRIDTSKSKPKLMAMCKVCLAAHRSEKFKQRYSSDLAFRLSTLAAGRARRGRNRVSAVMTDMRKSDKRAGREFSLTVELVARLLAQPCAYCGGTELQMTLDRKDNAVGHVPDNVVPACSRCNYVRRDMPERVWLMLAPAMRAAVAAGAFGDWTCQIHHRS